MTQAQRTVALTKRKRALEAELRTVKEELGELAEALLAAMEEGRFPASSHVDGMSVHLRSTLWAYPKQDESGNRDRQAVVEALRTAGLDSEYVKTDYNVSSLSAFVREQRKAEQAIHPALLEALDLVEKYEVRATVV